MSVTINPFTNVYNPGQTTTGSGTTSYANTTNRNGSRAGSAPPNINIMLILMLFLLGKLGNKKKDPPENLTLNGTSAADTLTGGAGHDTLNGAAGNDSLTAGAGSDLLNGDDGNDTLVAGAGLDTLRGGAGDDTYRVTSDADYTVIDDTAGTNSLNLNAFSSAAFSRNGYDLAITTGEDTTVLVKDYFDAQGNQGAGALSNITYNNGSQSLDFFAVLAEVYRGADTINGTSADETLNGNDGNDTISGLAGNDTLNGDNGNDILHGGTGNDQLNGGAGNDQLNGDDGNDTLNGGLGSDTLKGGAGDDTYTVGSSAGNVTIDDASGNNTLDLNAFSTINTNNYTRIGTDLKFTFGSGSTLKTVTLKNFFNTQGNQGSGVFNINYNNGASTLDFATIKQAVYNNGDNLTGTSSDDVMSGAGGNDTIKGGVGNDVLNGDDGADTLDGEAGNDTVNGGAGNDTLKGGGGIDILKGGAGNDRYVITTADGNVTIEDTEGTNHLDLNAFASVDSFVRGGDDNRDLIINLPQGRKVVVKNYFNTDGTQTPNIISTITYNGGGSSYTFNDIQQLVGAAP